MIEHAFQDLRCAVAAFVECELSQGTKDLNIIQARGSAFRALIVVTITV